MSSPFAPRFVDRFADLAAIARRLYPRSRAKRLRFVVRAGFYADVTGIWLDFLAADETLAALTRSQPWLIERLHRPFLRAGLRRRERLQALLDHYLICADLGWMPLLERLAAGPVSLARFRGKGEAYRLALGYAPRFGKEGEWTLQMYHDDARLYSLAFSFQRPRQPHLFIACLQGPTGEQARDAVRRATRDLHDMRPRDLIVDAAREIAQAAGMTHIAIVRTRDHVYRHPRSRLKKRNTRTAWQFDYDAWAAELGALAGDDGWMLPVGAQHRDPAELPSKKRAAARRRTALREQIGSEVRLALASAVAPVAMQATGEDMPAGPDRDFGSAA